MKNRFIFPLSLFLVLLLIFAVNIYWIVRKPKIISIEPKTLVEGQSITIKGTAFGSQKKGYIQINGNRIFKGLITQWSDREIQFQAPDNFTSGFLSVNNGNGNSKGVIVANSREFPPITSVKENEPILYKIWPENPVPGDEVSILGQNILWGKGTIEVILQTDAGDLILDPQYISSIEVDELTFLWPGHTNAYGLHILRQGFNSNVLNFDPKIQEVQREKGNTYIIEKKLSFSSASTAGQSELLLKIPFPKNFQGLQDIHLVYASHPCEIVDDFSELHLSILSKEQPVNHEVTFRFIVETSRREIPGINSKNLPKVGKESTLYKTYTKETDALPVSSNDIESILEYAQNGYQSSNRIVTQTYDYLIKRQEADPFGPQSVSESIKKRSSDALGYARFYTTLLRNGGIPSRIIQGVLLPESGPSLLHYWVEVFLSEYGWIIVDPALADGLNNSVLPEDYKAAIGTEHGQYLPLREVETIVYGQIIESGTLEVEDPYGGYSHIEISKGTVIENWQDNPYEVIGFYSF